MATNFPTSLDSYTTKNQGDTINNTDVNNPQSAIVALETKVGIDSSADTTTLDYKLKNTASINPGHHHTDTSLDSLAPSKLTTVVPLTKGGTASDLSATGGASQFLKQTSSGAAITVAQPTEADLSMSDITTNNVSTAKHGFVPKAPNSTSQYLRGDGTWATIASDIPTMYFPSVYENASQYSTGAGGGGVATIVGGQGGKIDTSATSGGFAQIDHRFTGGGGNQVNIFSRSSRFSARINLNTAGTTLQSFFGICLADGSNVSGTGYVYTYNEYGFKIIGASSVYTLYGTNGNGTTETATAALTTLSAGDWIDVMAVFTVGTGVDYYWSKNGGAWSAATTNTTNLPTTTISSFYAQVSAVSNVSTATQTVFMLEQAMFIS